MRILKIIHGYPPEYNAGSEVYSQLLCNALQAEGHEVVVFSREENPFIADYSVRVSHDPDNPNIKCHLVNIPLERHRYCYSHVEVDDRFEELLLSFQPNIVHIGHLNHLSITIVDRVKKYNLPIVYTIHDFWLLCPRGQFIQRNSRGNEGLYAVCTSQENRKCARQCYAGYFSGFSVDLEKDEGYWEAWVERRMMHIHRICKQIDLFVAPSKALIKRYVNDFNFIRKKLIYMDYGFKHDYLIKRSRQKESDFVFGYIGTHIPAKGIDVLLNAFAKIQNQSAKLRIWGRPRGQNTQGLKRLAETFPQQVRDRIEWMPEYKNNEITQDVFNWVDAIVVPSIWQENSPLVIHEALQAKVGVITADFGGMCEYVQHEENGWLFVHRDEKSLAEVMDKVIADVEKFHLVRQRGYLFSDSGNTISIAQQAKEFEGIYLKLIEGQANGR